ncbi:hypothetical protein VTJ04DRAFT_3572 [Mycothermus thermophilus]|uniref:uncharacterized protein n=1 Tax=Humicola insolens TaxID=85995 RepID=UPI003743213B
MQLLKAFTLALCSLPAVMAANEPCSYWDGNKYGTVQGWCAHPDICKMDMGYIAPVNNLCPGGPENKCCIRRLCTTTGGRPGACTTIKNCQEKYGYGHNQSGRCPGPGDVQCCY